MMTNDDSPDRDDTNRLNADIDNDDILDGLDNCLLTSNTNQMDEDLDGEGNVCDRDFFKRFALVKSNDGIAKIATVSVRSEGPSVVQVNDGLSGAFLTEHPGGFRLPREVVSLSGQQDNFLGVITTAVERVDLNAGFQSGAIHWPNFNSWIDTTAVPGTSPDQPSTIATLLSNTIVPFESETTRPFIQVKDVDNGLLQEFYPLSRNWSARAVKSIQVNGTRSLAILATRKVDGLTVVQTRSLTGDLMSNVFPLGMGWTPRDLIVLPDLNGNGSDEVAVAMVRDVDGLFVVQVRDGLSGEKLSNVYAIGSGLSHWRIQRVGAVNLGDETVIAFFAVSEIDHQLLLQLKNPMTGEIVNNIHFIGQAWRYSQGITVLPDYSGDHADEVGAIMFNPEQGRYLVQIRSTSNGEVVVNIPIR